MARIAAVAPAAGEGRPPGGLWESILQQIEEGHRVEPVPARPSVLERLGRFDLCLFEVGPAWPAYGPAYELAARHPGLVLLVATEIRGLIESLAAGGSPIGAEAAAEARLRLDSSGFSGREAGVWCSRLVRRSLGIMVSSSEDEMAVRALGYPTPLHPANKDGGAVAREAVEHCLARATDLLQKSVRRWAMALAESGATMDLLQRGYGVRYADALETIGGASR